MRLAFLSAQQEYDCIPANNAIDSLEFINPRQWNGLESFALGYRFGVERPSLCLWV
jgi:hypothetical protein